MEIQNKSFRNGMSWVFESLKICATNFLDFFIPAFLSAVCVSLASMSLIMLFSFICRILSLPDFLNVFLITMSTLFVGFVTFFYAVGYIRVIRSMLDGNKITFKSFFEIFKNDKLCLKLIPFFIVVVIMDLGVVGLYYLIMFLVVWAVKSSFVFGIALIVGYVLAIYLFVATYFALILFITRKEAKIWATILDSIKAINNNLKAFVGVLVAFVLSQLFAYVLLAVLYYLLFVCLNSYGIIIFGIFCWILAIFYNMFIATTLTKIVKEVCQE